jgi:hypothetical protein
MVWRWIVSDLVIPDARYVHVTAKEREQLVELLRETYVSPDFFHRLVYDYPVTATEAQFLSKADEVWVGDKINIDSDARVSIADGGAWVMAWVWVGAPESEAGDGDNA